MADPFSRPHRRRRYAVVACIGAILLVTATAFVWWHSTTRHDQTATRTPPPPIPVTTDVAAIRDVPIYLSGLGNVQASNTTAIHTQVDGKLQSVSFVEGQSVRKGDILIQIDPRYYQAALDQAKAKKAQDQAQLVGAQKDLERFRTLVAKLAETQQNFDRQTAVVGQVTASIDADTAAIESAQTQLDYTTIRAPTDGRMGIRQIDPGNIVHVADAAPMVILTQTKPISVIFTLPEKNLADVRRAMARGPATVIAYDADEHQPLATGTLMLIDNQIDQTTGTIKLKATFPNDKEELWSGEFVHAHVQIETRKNAVTVPAAALERGPDGFHVWRVNADGVAEALPVQTRDMQGDIAVIDQGISGGDRVVIKGQYRLQQGSHVDAKPIAATTAGGGP